MTKAHTSILSAGAFSPSNLVNGVEYGTFLLLNTILSSQLLNLLSPKLSFNDESLSSSTDSDGLLLFWVWELTSFL